MMILRRMQPRDRDIVAAHGDPVACAFGVSDADLEARAAVESDDCEAVGVGVRPDPHLPRLRPAHNHVRRWDRPSPSAAAITPPSTASPPTATIRQYRHHLHHQYSNVNATTTAPPTNTICSRDSDHGYDNTRINSKETITTTLQDPPTTSTRTVTPRAQHLKQRQLHRRQRPQQRQHYNYHHQQISTRSEPPPPSQIQ